MTTTPTLFDVTPADVLAPVSGAVHRTDPDTSRAAASDGIRLAGQRRDVLVALAAAPEGLTGFEAHGLTPCRWPHVATTRLEELARLGLAEQTDGRRPTDTGHLAAVWMVTDAGRTVAAELRAS